MLEQYLDTLSAGIRHSIEKMAEDEICITENLASVIPIVQKADSAGGVRDLFGLWNQDEGNNP